MPVRSRSACWATITPRSLIPGEIVPADEFYTYNAKYYDERSALLIPAPISDELVAQVQELALRAYRADGLRWHGPC